MSSRLPTGITVLDRRLGGGIPAGSIVLLEATPASQSELFLYEFTAVRETLYLTTIRSQAAVRDAFEQTDTETGDPTIREIGSDAPLDHANRLVGALPDGANLIIDVVDVLEWSEQARFRSFLNELQTQMVNTGGLAILHGLNGRAVPKNRDVTEHMADVVFDLNTEVRGKEIINRLAVPKFRGGAAMDETIKLKLMEEVRVDTSRDIA